jgi:hypothetical protein
MADFGGKKCVVGADGTAAAVDLTAAEVTQRNADDAAFQGGLTAETTENTRLATFTTDADYTDLLDRLKTATAAQIDTWVDANVSNIAQARAVFKKIIKVMALMAKKL